MAPKSKSDSYYRRVAKKNWVFWRPVLSGVVPYSNALEMDFEELHEANAALDIYIEKQKKGNPSKGKK